jgi:transcriptional regulator with XRE-family HTH domain
VGVTRDEQTRVQRIKQYVLARLRDEVATAPRGAQAQLAKKLGVSGAHLSNMLSTSPSRQPGEDFRRKVAAHWGVSYATLEALALGEEPPPASTQQAIANVGAVPARLVTALTEYRWLPELPAELRLVVREQARLYQRVVDDLDEDEWRRIITGLEREALGFIARRASVPPLAPKKKRARPRA